jgi:hypothetical protein
VYPGASSVVVINDVDICVDGVAILTATIVNGSGGGTSIWQSSPDSLTWSDIPNENAPTYLVPTGAPHTTYYRFYTVEPPQSACPSPVISNVALAIVRPDPQVSVTVSSGMICIGGTSTLTANITGGSAAQIIQWQSGTTLSGPWADISGANDTTYIVIYCCGACRCYGDD